MKIIIFAGGVGTRLWPLSRKNTPKQFGKIIGEYSTLQHTVKRLLPEFKAEDIYIATGERYKYIVSQQLPEIPSQNFIYEPEMRDVCPAIGLTSFILEKNFPNTPVAILWSDHVVKDEEGFRQTLRFAEQTIESKGAEFVFIGQKPRFPNQNIGWIKMGEEVEGKNNNAVHRFKKLIYRPRLSDAQEFFKSNKYVWNLGYFVTTPQFLKELYKSFVPHMYNLLLKIQESYGTDSYVSTLSDLYPSLDKISFDDAILQRLDKENIYVISADLGWSDVGAWEALKEALSDKEEENVTHGKVMLEDCRDSLLFNYGEQLCVGIDLDKMVIINTDDALLICPKTSVPKIKKLVESLTGTTHEHLT